MVVEGDANRDTYTFRGWLDSMGLSSIRRWPGDTAPAPWVIWSTSDAGELELTSGIDLFGQSVLLCVARAARGREVLWSQKPDADDAIAVVAAELVRVIAFTFITPPSDTQRADEGMCLPAPDLGGREVGVHSQRTWHIPAGDVMWRIFETDPIEGPQSIRARTAVVIDPTEPLKGYGTVAWTSVEVRWWPAGTSPLLDAPDRNPPEVIRKFAAVVLP